MVTSLCTLSSQELDPEERARWSPPGPGERGALNAVHLRAVQRIYGEAGQQVRAGSFLLLLAVGGDPLHPSTAGYLSTVTWHFDMQMGELLRKNPAVAVPVVLARLVQKDSEWCATAVRAFTSELSSC